MSHEPEGFLVVDEGEFGRRKDSTDLDERIPSVYASPRLHRYVDRSRHHIVESRARQAQVRGDGDRKDSGIEWATFELVGAKHFRTRSWFATTRSATRQGFLTEPMKGLFTREQLDDVAYFDSGHVKTGGRGGRASSIRTKAILRASGRSNGGDSWGRTR
jgi:hypothetical protein